MPRYDRCLNSSVTLQHMPENLLQASKRCFTSNVIGGANFLFRDQIECPTHCLRSMVEGGFQRDLRIVQAVGIKLDLGAAGASAEEVHGATFTNHVDSQLPGFRTTHGFDDNVAAALIGRECPHGFP